MLKMRLKEIINDSIIYYFQPECRSEEGIIKFTFEDEKLIEYVIIEDSEYRCNSMYIYHCLSLVNKMKKEGEFLKECFSAWY